jgi:hypothetical protein
MVKKNGSWGKFSVSMQDEMSLGIDELGKGKKFSQKFILKEITRALFVNK